MRGRLVKLATGIQKKSSLQVKIKFSSLLVLSLMLVDLSIKTYSMFVPSGETIELLKEKNAEKDGKESKEKSAEYVIKFLEFARVHSLQDALLRSRHKVVYSIAPQFVSEIPDPPPDLV